MPTDENIFLKALWFSLGVVLCLTLGHGVGRATGKRQKEREAIAVGVAHWEADKDGSAQFRWNYPPTKPPTP